MNKIETVEMRAVSTKELEQTEGGWAVIVGILIGGGSAFLGGAIGEDLKRANLGSALAGIGRAAAPK